MFKSYRYRVVATSLLAALMASAGSAAIAGASEFDGEGDDDEDGAALKRAACSFIGCANGNRVCGTASGTFKIGVQPFVGEVGVSYTCYESPAQ